MTKHPPKRQYQPSDLVIKRMAKHLVQQCFRNTFLEDLHAGVVPHTATGDYLDVQVVTPAGEIPWNDVSRLNDEEMKRLMMEAVAHTYAFLKVVFSERTGAELCQLLSLQDVVPQWFDPGETDSCDP